MGLCLAPSPLNLRDAFLLPACISGGAIAMKPFFVAEAIHVRRALDLQFDIC